MAPWITWDCKRSRLLRKVLLESEENWQERIIREVSWCLGDNDQWLLIIDNSDDDGTLRLVHKLHQSRNARWRPFDKYRCSRRESLGLYRGQQLTTRWGPKIPQEQLGGVVNADGNIRDEVNHLLSELGHWTLVVDQAGYYAATSGKCTSLCEIIDSTSKWKKSRLLSQPEPGRYDKEYKCSVWTTWDLSYQKVREKHPSASLLLAIITAPRRRGISLSVSRDENSRIGRATENHVNLC